MPFLTRLIASQMKTLPPLPDKDMSGHTYIVTGANCGIGLEIARHLVAHKASQLILAVRNLPAGENARLDLLDGFKAKGTETEILVWQLDLASYQSVADFAKRAEQLDRIDGIAMNAGMLGGQEMQYTEDRHEIVSQVNVLSPTILALLLAPRLVAQSTPTRVIFTGSTVAEVAPTKNLDPNDPIAGLNSKKRFRPSDRYNESKLVLHSAIRSLIAYLPGAIITDVNPGFVATPLYRNSSGMARFMSRRIGRTAEEGARNISMALLTLDESTDFFHDCQPTPIHAPWLETADGKTFAKNLWKELLEEAEKVRQL